MDKILTVTIPAYNVEKYLEECVGTLCVDERIEVLIVNDGSTDNTYRIAQKLCEGYPDIIKVINKMNGGHGSAVNAGMTNATGRYFKVVDADDWVDTGNMLELIEIMSDKDFEADMVVSPFDCVIGDKKKHKKCDALTVKNIKYFKQYNMKDVSDKFFARMHSIIFRTQILKDNNIRLDEHCYYVDMEYNLFAIPYIKKVYFTDKSIYMYRLGYKEQSVSVKNMQKNRQQHERVFERLIEYYCEQESNGTEGVGYIARGCALMLENQIQIYLSLPYSKAVEKELKDMDVSVMTRCPQVYNSVTKKSVHLLRMSGYHLFRLASFVYRRIYSKLK